MNGQSLFESGLHKIPMLEQAMYWLHTNGPLIEEPELPNWILKRLVAQQRILRLRKGLYLIPSSDGSLPRFPALISLLDPDGYISFYAALILYGLTDQDTGWWVVVTSERQAPISYGPYTAHFFASPARHSAAVVTVQDVRGIDVRVATAEQAFCDTLLFPRYGPGLTEMFRILRTGLGSKRLSVSKVRELVLREDSPSLARRVGFLLELATDRVDEQLLRLAHRTHDRTVAWPGNNGPVDERWRLVLPADREAIVCEARW